VFAPVTSSDASEAAKGPPVHENFFSRVKRMRGLDIRERDSHPKRRKLEAGKRASQSVANKSVRDNGLRSHLRYC
jgi:hypothetical protein